jgi:hypothetical protein
MSTMLLAASELRELTGKARSDAQRRALDRMGILYRLRPDGTLAVLRVHVEMILGAGSTIQAPEPELRF